MADETEVLNTVQTKRYIRRTANRLSDRDMLLDLLMTEKYMAHIYNSAIVESTHTPVLEAFEDMAHDEHSNARSLFEAMQDKGWYYPEPDSDPKVHLSGRNARMATKYNSDYAVTSGSKNFGSRLVRRSSGTGSEYSGYNRPQ